MEKQRYFLTLDALLANKKDVDDRLKKIETDQNQDIIDISENCPGDERRLQELLCIRPGNLNPEASFLKLVSGNIQHNIVAISA